MPLMYLEYLESGGHADGLEVLLVSVAMDININVIQDDVVWASSRGGIHFTDPMIVWIMVGALPCKYCDPEDGNLADADTSRTTDSADRGGVAPQCLSEPEAAVPSTLLHQPNGGRPLVSVPEHCEASSSDTTDTNPDDQLSVDLSMKRRCKNPDSGHMSPQTCMVCHVKLKSKGALAFHLKHFHRDHRLYQCDICQNSFNNKYDLSSYHSNVHTPKVVSCKHCAYQTTSKSQMRLHVRAHMMGIWCSICLKSFLHKHALSVHTPLHGCHQEYPCSSCSLLLPPAIA